MRDKIFRYAKDFVKSIIEDIETNQGNGSTKITYLNQSIQLSKQTEQILLDLTNTLKEEGIINNSIHPNQVAQYILCSVIADTLKS